MADTSNAVEGSTLECNNCEISEAVASYGAVIFSEDGNTIKLTDTSISNCETTEVSSIVVYNNYLDITQSSFTQNIAGTTGVIAIMRDSNVNITDCNFTENAVGDYGYGGAIYIGDNNNINILRDRFEGNTAGLGGAVAMQTGLGSEDEENTVDINVEDSWFENNMATISGGAFYAKRQSARISQAETYYHNIKL